jgi:hypothetical protein
MDAGLVVAANHDGHILHFLDSSLAVRRSIGEPFRRDTMPMIQAQYDRENMLVTCDRQRGRLFVVEGHQSIVRAYDAAGRLLWQNELPNYSGYRVTVHHEIRNATSYFMGEFSTKTIALVAPDLLIVQASHKTQRRSGPTGGLQVTAQGVVTYVLSATSGAVLTRSTSAPFFLADNLAGEEMVAFNNDPFPRAFVTRVTRVQTRRQ